MNRSGRLAATLAAAPLILMPLVGVPSIAQAAKMKPEGFALVSVSGGTATTKEIGKHRYRITTPLESEVYWIGKVQGKGDRTGTFSRDELVKGWSRLGYRPDKGAPATLSWRESTSDPTQTRSALVTNPKVNKDGNLVFTAKIVDRTGNNLPASMPNFIISMQRPDSVNARGYPIYWKVETLSSTFGWVVSTGGDTSGSAQFQYKDSTGAWTPCQQAAPATGNVPSASGGGTTSKSFPFNGFTCGGSTVVTSNTITYIAWQYQKTWTGITVCTYAQVPSGSTSVSRCGTKYSWDHGGSDPIPST
ncbi:MAG: hypothetical protein ACR2KE_00295 [Candidatus Nanopelagicales bacterium]